MCLAGQGELALDRCPVHLRYDLELPVGERTWVVHFDDWLLLQPGEVVINRAQVTKLGLRIGEMVAFFAKVDEDEAGGARR